MLLAVLVFMLAVGAAAQSPTDAGNPPPLLRGGFVQQLRSLSENAIDSLQNKGTSDRPGNASSGSRPPAPRMQSPPQPTGRATLRRTNPSAWLERFDEDSQPLAERTQPLAVPVGGIRRQNTGPLMFRDPQAARVAQAARDVQNDRDDGASSGPQPIRDPAPIQTPRNPFVRSDTTDTIDEQAAAPIVTAPKRGQPRPRSTTGPLNAPDGIPDVHVAETLPPAVRRSIAGYAASLPKATKDSQVGQRADAVTDAQVTPPQVSRIPLPRRTPTATGRPADTAVAKDDEPLNSNLTVPQSDAARTQSAVPLAPTDLATDASIPATLVSTPHAEPKSGLTPNSGNEQFSLPQLPDIPSLPSQLLSSASPEMDVDAKLEFPGGPTLNESLPVAPSALSSDSRLSLPVDAFEQALPSIPLPSLPIPTLPLTSNSSERLTATLPESALTLPAVEKQPVASPPSLNRAPASARPTPATTDESAERLRMETPRIAVLLEGPEDLPVGRPANYSVRVLNQDSIPLSGLVLRVDVPPGVATQAGQPSRGEMLTEQAGDRSTLLTWMFEGLEAGGSAVAPVQLTAQSARNFGLAMEWTVTPVTGETQLDVMAPALELILEGPAEVAYGEANTYRLRIKNPGTADAADVSVTLTAEAYGSSSSEIGMIPAGAEENVDVELTFNEAGTIHIAAAAKGADGLSAETRIDVLVRQPNLVTSIDAPAFVYHGTRTNFLIRVANTGDAPAKTVAAKLTLPAGATLVDLPSQTTLVGRELNWDIAEIAPGIVVELPIQLSLSQEGENILAVDCRSSGGITSQCTGVTQVQAVADLKLLVADPVAPAPIGDEVCYELTLTNRGSKGAHNVRVIAQFSDGIEPVRGEGAGARVVPGQILFDPIQQVEPGQSIKIKVYAVAAKIGMHRFRAEVRTDDSDMRLVQEASTTYLEGVGRIAAPINARPIIR